MSIEKTVMATQIPLKSGNLQRFLVMEALFVGAGHIPDVTSKMELVTRPPLSCAAIGGGLIPKGGRVRWLHAIPISIP